MSRLVEVSASKTSLLLQWSCCSLVELLHSSGLVSCRLHLYTVHTLYIHCTYTVHTLYIHCIIYMYRYIVWNVCNATHSTCHDVPLFLYVQTQTPDGPLPLLFQPNHPQSSSSSHLDEVQAQDEEAPGGTAGRGRGFVSGIGRRALILRLPRQRPRPLVTTKTCLGCRMYRPRTTFAAFMMLTGGLVCYNFGSRRKALLN